MSHKAYDRPLQHQEYIKLKYLSQTDDKNKEISKKTKKKKLVSNKSKKIRIFDDDIDLKKIEANGSDDEIYFGTKEEKPVIAEIVDERPLHMRRKDIDTNRWKAVGFDGEEDEHKSVKTVKLENNSIKAKKSFNLKKNNETKASDKIKRHSATDLSPTRSETTNSQTKAKRHDSDSDLSPERPSLSDSSKNRTKLNEDLSPPRHRLSKRESNNRRHDSDSDLSPERPSKVSHHSRDVSRSRAESHKDLSPPRHRSKSDSNSRRHDSDSDLSPPRVIRANNTSAEDKKRELTLGGKKAGLSDAKLLREELLATKRKEQKVFESISDEMLGKNAKTVFRDSKSGKIRDLEEEARLQFQKDLIKDKIDSEKKAKYEKWSKGLVQTQERKEKIESDLHEMSKPLARYEGDEDLDQMLRQKEREDDPMIETIRQNKTKQQMREEGIKVRPEYKGPPPPINRFNIRPGYRWDGVDRSNGFEKKYFDRISNKESTLEEAYRWSTQDM